MEDTMPEFVERYNREQNDHVYMISSKGWAPYEPLHPLREGHKIIAEKLVAEWNKLGI